ncbi:MAG: damage-control phosphatase ARMT1 family protein [Rhodothermales bacterium]
MPMATPLRTDPSNAFAYHSMKVRVPSIIAGVIARNADYPDRFKDDLQHLHDAIVTDQPMRPLPAPAPDFDAWQSAFASFDGETWLNTQWLFAEFFAYRWINHAVDYWRTARDPFAPFKADERERPELWEVLGEALAIDAPTEAHLRQLMLYMLWGNRIDLSLKASADQGTTAQDDHLLTDELDAAVHHLLSHAPAPLHVVMDNAGTEQAMDLAFVDYILRTDVATNVTLHVKLLPVLVSDVIPNDMPLLLTSMHERGGTFTQLAIRLQRFLDTGRLRIIPDGYWNEPLFLDRLPNRLARPMQQSRLVILKGDANYRRATHDALWPDGTTLGDILSGFPTSVLALRTLKSDTLAGVDAATQARLNAQHHGDTWRTNGTYGVAEFVRSG